MVVTPKSKFCLGILRAMRAETMRLIYRTQMRVERSRSCQALQGVPLRRWSWDGGPLWFRNSRAANVEAIHRIGGRKMSDLGRLRDRSENTLVPDLLGWMGAAFGDAVDRAGVRSLRLGRAQMEDVIRALPAAIYTTDAAGRITFYNEAAAELWGCRPELGKSEFCGSWKLYWPDGTPLPHGECPMALALKEQRAIRGMEAVAERPDGTRVHFIPYPTPLFDDFGILVGAVNMLIDISDQKRGDVDRQRLASIVDSSDDAIVSKDLNGTITSWNRGAERIFGYTAAEAVGRPINILIPENRVDEEPEILARIARGEPIEHYETVRRRKNGQLIDI